MVKKLALVTGGNRGLGYATCRELAKLGYQVILTSRDESDGKQARERLREVGEILYHPLDVGDSSSIAGIHRWVSSEFKRLDVLVNNAGITDRAASAERKTLLDVFNVNVAGAYEMCRLFLPMMVENNFGRVVNVSSKMGQLSEMGPGSPAYRISKAAMNAVTVTLAAEVTGKNILINSVHPGWVRTDMGGASAPRGIDEGIETIVWAATLPNDGPAGRFLFDRKPIPW